jgi:hypothetical protein
MRALPLLCSCLPLAAQSILPCGTPSLSAGLQALDGPPDCSMTSTNPLPAYAPVSLWRIPVVFHVIRDSSGLGDVPLQRIRDQVEVLNEYFRALPGTPGAQGRDAGIEFELATVDPAGNPTTGVTVSTNAQWFQDQGSYWLTLAWDPRRYANVYTNLARGYLAYAWGLPQQGVAGRPEDRIVIRFDAVGRNAPFGPPNDMGRALVHEFGHYLGLLHTFESINGACAPQAGCYANGDLVCDTNTHTGFLSGCQPMSSCGLPDPIHNHMNYGADACLWEFTPEQIARMRCTLQHWRPLVGRNLPFARAMPRTAGANVQSLTAEPPVVGATFDVVVDMTSTGTVIAGLVVALAPASVPMPGNQFVLVDLQGPVAFVVQVAPLYVATWPLPVPNAAPMYGMGLSLQAAHFGGPSPVLPLSNAVDLVLGAR